MFQSLRVVQLKAQAPIALRREVGIVSSPAGEEHRVQEGVYSTKKFVR